MHGDQLWNSQTGFKLKKKPLQMAEKACHEITLVTHTNGQRFTYYRNNCLLERICTHTVVVTIWAVTRAVRAELQYFVKIEIQKRLALFRNPQSFVDWLMEKSKRYNFFLLIWRVFNISSHLIIVWIYVSRADK